MNESLSSDNAWLYSSLHHTQLPITLHFLMFSLCIQYLGDDDQAQELMPLVKDMKIIGNYSQTEMGHGSNVRGLMTTAKYDKKTKEFVINTPCAAAAKCWPGDLGVTSTHAAVFAQMEVDGTNYGPQCFVVPIRDPVSHAALPGIEVGDIGPKYGFDVKDNGYMILSDVRVPRRALLSRYIGVDAQGEVKM